MIPFPAHQMSIIKPIYILYGPSENITTCTMTKPTSNKLPQCTYPMYPGGTYIAVKVHFHCFTALPFAALPLVWIVVAMDVSDLMSSSLLVADKPANSDVSLSMEAAWSDSNLDWRRKVRVTIAPAIHAEIKVRINRHVDGQEQQQVLMRYIHDK